MEIRRFVIKNLFGDRTIDIPIHKNRLVIVGVNGIGKSTVLNALYYFLARRWKKLSEISFGEISLEINGTELKLLKDDLDEYLTKLLNLRRFVRYGFHRGLEAADDVALFTSLLQDPISQTEISHWAIDLKISPSEVMRLRRQLMKVTEGEPTLFGNAGQIIKIDSFLRHAINSRILFLPTYRRIEKDLRTIVPEIEQRVRSYEERMAKRGSELGRREGVQYIDLVEFGMEDVNYLIQETLLNINLQVRQKLNELAGIYLREVIRGVVDDFDAGSISEYSDRETQQILDRVEERLLSSEDKAILVTTLRKFRVGSGEVSERDKYIAHFFYKDC